MEWHTRTNVGRRLENSHPNSFIQIYADFLRPGKLGKSVNAFKNDNDAFLISHRKFLQKISRDFRVLPY